MLVCSLFFLINLFFGYLEAQAVSELTGRDIMQKVEDNSQYHKTKVCDITMLIQDKKGRERKKSFKCYTKRSDRIDNSLIRLYYPPDSKNMGVLTKSTPGRSGKEQWLYVHFSRMTKQLVGKAKNASFLGSHFSYADIGGRQFDADTYRRLPDQQGYLVVEIRPIAGAVGDRTQIDYDRILSYIDPQRFVVISQVYYSVSQPDQVLKVLTNKKIVKREGMYITVLAEMVDGAGQGKTTVIVDEHSLQLGVSISDQQVDLKGLKFS